MHAAGSVMHEPAAAMHGIDHCGSRETTPGGHKGRPCGRPAEQWLENGPLQQRRTRAKHDAWQQDPQRGPHGLENRDGGNDSTYAAVWRARRRAGFFTVWRVWDTVELVELMHEVNDRPKAKPGHYPRFRSERRMRSLWTR
jgi:hypothetical protein